MNNNFLVETIAATNPCVTADTRLHTQYGMVPIGELQALSMPLDVTVDRRSCRRASRSAAPKCAPQAGVHDRNLG